MRKLIALFVILSLFAAEASAQAVVAPPASSNLLQMLLGLVGILALLFGSLWLLKKLATQRSVAAGLLRVVAATAVGGRERVVIVEVGSTWLVLGVAPGRVSALAEIPRQPLPEAPPGSGKAAAADWLYRLMQRR
jgi:flagellar protein FliO/FliZ